MNNGVGCLASGLQTVAFLGNGLLFLLIEWSFIAGNWLHFFNPILHIQVILIMLITPFFWLLTGVGVVGVVLERLAGGEDEEEPAI